MCRDHSGALSHSDWSSLLFPGMFTHRHQPALHQNVQVVTGCVSTKKIVNKNCTELHKQRQSELLALGLHLHQKYNKIAVTGLVALRHFGGHKTLSLFGLLTFNRIFCFGNLVWRPIRTGPKMHSSLPLAYFVSCPPSDLYLAILVNWILQFVKLICKQQPHN